MRCEQIRPGPGRQDAPDGFTGAPGLHKIAAMTHPVNFRAYGILLRGNQVLIAAEYVGDVFAWKFPGGGIDPFETAAEGLAREFREETGLAIRVGRLLHAPGTLMSPWTHRPYTPEFYAVLADGVPAVPPGESVTIDFKDPFAAIASGLMAGPDIYALNRALEARG